VTRREKLLAGIRSHPKGVRFEDACKAAGAIGFSRAGGKGSHVVYARTGEPVILNFQNRGGYVPPYQARQLIEMMDKYGG
jgi:hypothetical protein